MASPPPDDLEQIAQRIGELDPTDFEHFCQELVVTEAYERHRSPTIDGPRRAGSPDGGRDVLLTLTQPPEISKFLYQSKYRLAPLTEDPTESHYLRTAYSCKASEDWFTLAMRDAEKRGKRVLEVLAEGGYFKLIINQSGVRDAPIDFRDESRLPVDHLSRALHKRLQKEDPNSPDPRSRVAIIDAHELARFFSQVCPADVRHRWANQLGTARLLHSLEEWVSDHREDRTEPPFEEDNARANIRADLVQWLSSRPATADERVAWIIGPPGVGKTRLVIEVLNHTEGASARANIAFSPEEALNALNAGLLERAPSSLLVVDDCPASEVRSLTAKFRASLTPGSNAHLLVVTPASPEATEPVRRVQLRQELDALDDQSVRKMVVQALGSANSDTRVEQITRLAKGFPWFAILLSREARVEGKAPSGIDEAVQWALATKAEEQQRRGIRLLRARALLAAILTNGLDWVQLDPEEQGNLAKAVGLGQWEDVKGLAQECHQRGLLRRREGWKYKYVTPAILEREVIRWLLSDPDGDDPGGRRLRRFAPSFVDELFDRIQTLELLPSLLQAMAHPVIEEVKASSSWEELVERKLLGIQLRVASQFKPASMSIALRDHVVNSSLELLRERVDVRRDLMFALDGLLRTREGFGAAEQAVFRLSQAENEAYANNATSVWSSIFLVTMNHTYLSISERMELLARRCHDEMPSGRLVALNGIKAALATQALLSAHDPTDGPFPVPTDEEASKARTFALHLLQQQINDEASEVALAAKRLAVRHVRQALRLGVLSDLIDVLVASVTTLDDQERVLLRSELEAIHAYDQEMLSSEEKTRLSQLEDILIPRSYAERVRQSVGSWGPVTQRVLVSAEDDALATEGLGKGTPVANLLDWLLSEDAVRAKPFLEALGRADSELSLLAPLRERATDRHNELSLVSFLVGRAQRDNEQVNRILEQWMRTESCVPLAVALIAALGANDKTASWLEQQVRVDRLDDDTLVFLLRPGWLRNVSTEQVVAILDALVQGKSRLGYAAAIDALSDMSKENVSLEEPFLRLAEQAVVRSAPHFVSGFVDYQWEQVARVAIAAGKVESVAQASLVALTRGQSANENGWNVLHAAAEQSPLSTWTALAHVLERRDAMTGRVLLGFRFHRRSFDWPTDAVLQWVGHDPQRGRAVVSLLRPATTPFSPILRGLVHRFGSQSSIANEIEARMHSTERAVNSLSEHDAERIVVAKTWLEDPDLEVQAFAHRLLISLERSKEEHAAEEEHERRRWGT